MNQRIAYITAGADTQYELEMIKTMSKQAYLLGYDLVVLTHFVNYTDDRSYIKCDENIYSLIDSIPLDGAIFNYNSYFSTKLADEIEDKLFRKAIPVISLDYQSKRFEGSIQSDRESFRRLTEHFIKVHGFRKIYCLSGPENDIHSTERINGYKDALRENGIRFRKKNVFYGDFWIYSPAKLADDILSGKIEKPQAVVCGNDYMALHLCISLSKGGINIPDEIAVGGYDGNPDVLRYHPSVTTFYGANLSNAVNAVCRLHEMISGEPEYPKTEITTDIRIGTSCGCQVNVSQEAYNSQKSFDSTLIGNIYLHSNYSSMMNKVTSLEECAMAVSQNIYLLDEKSDFFICICNDWDSAENYRSEGYSDEMTCIFTSLQRNCNGTQIRFPLRDILPPDSDNTPMTYFCTPLHYLERCCGYCVRRYRDEIVFEEYYGEFCQIAANAIEKVRMLRYEKMLNEKIQKLSERDMLTGLFSRRGLEVRLKESDKNKRYFGILYYLGYDSEDIKAELSAAFAQAVNLSISSGMIAARTTSESFIIVGMCNDSEHPEQLFVNTLNVNLRSIEKQQNISLLDSLTHFVCITEPDSLIEQLEEKLESFKRSGSEKNSIFLSQIRKLHYEIYEEPQFKWDSATEAKRIGISQSYFQHLYRQFMNVSFNADVITARIALAEQLLINTSYNVSEISERCGYSDVSHFMKLFRRKKGVTALSFRKTGRPSN